MKKRDAVLISRGIDGELDSGERKRLNELLSENPEAAGVAHSWEKMGEHLRGVSGKTTLPDPSLAWVDIQRAIRQQEPVVTESPATGFMDRLRWASALAVVAVAGILGLSAWQLMKGSPVVEPQVSAVESRVEWVIPEIPGATTMIYTDEETDMTVIWMDVAQNTDPRNT